MSSSILSGSPRLGAARVGLVWLVVVLVVALAALYLAFSNQSTVTEKQGEITKKEDELKEAKGNTAKESEFASNLTRQVGWYDKQMAAPRTNLKTLEAAFAEFKGGFPDLGSAAADFETALPLITQAFKARGDEIAELKERIKGLEAQLSAEQSATAQLRTEKEGQISDLDKRLSDETANAAQLQSELQARLDRAVATASATDSEKRNLQKDMEDREREHVRTVQKYEARLSQMKQITAFAEAPFADQPDARVLQVSDKLGMAWIDVGAKNRLATGTRFRVDSGAPGSRHQKAWAEVVKVDSDQAQVRIENVVDRFDPVVPGDVLINPVYDAQGERNAVLIGRFSGNYDEKSLKDLLGRMGIRVQEQLDLTTSYLIVGSEIWTDESGQPLETPLQPAELPVYKEAQSMGVQIVPIQDFRSYFKL